MRLLVTAAILAASFLPSAAYAQDSAPGFWFDSWGKTPTSRAVDLTEAEAQLRARNNGYGPGQSTTNYNGTVNSYATYNGDVVSSGSTNIGQANATTTTMSGSNLTLSVSTGQHIGSSNQQAGSSAATGNSTSVSGTRQGPRS